MKSFSKWVKDNFNESINDLSYSDDKRVNQRSVDFTNNDNSDHYAKDINLAKEIIKDLKYQTIDVNEATSKLVNAVRNSINPSVVYSNIVDDLRFEYKEILRTIAFNVPSVRKIWANVS